MLSTLRGLFPVQKQAIISESDAVDIYKKVIGDFVFPGQSAANKYNAYYKKKDGEKFSSRFDEPTYLTFRINFDIKLTKLDNIDDYVNGINAWKKYDYLPHPLLQLERTTAVEGLLSKDIISYSSVDYLKNVLGETYRADLLEKFVKGLNDIQTLYPYYFTSIDGLGDLLKVDPTTGRRIKDNTTITINCIEALDLRITQLLNLYRKAAWDDVYQRWILPDMMRFFKMDIYISEIRTFHSTKATKYAEKQNDRLVESPSSKLGGNSATDTKKFITLANDVINEILPTIKLSLSQCEFDISDTMSYLNSLKSTKDSSPLPKIKIKVGNVEETQMYGLNKNIEMAINANSQNINISDFNLISDEDINKYIITEEKKVELTEDNKAFKTDTPNAGAVQINVNNQQGAKEETPEPPKPITTVLKDCNLISSTLKRTGTDLSENTEYETNWSPNSQSSIFGNMLKATINEGLGHTENAVMQGLNKLDKLIEDSEHGDALKKTAQALKGVAYGDTGALMNMIRQSIIESSAAKDAAIANAQNSQSQLPNEALKNALEEVYNRADSQNQKSPVMQEIKWMIDNNMTGAEMSDHIDKLISDEINYTNAPMADIPKRPEVNNTSGLINPIYYKK